MRSLLLALLVGCADPAASPDSTADAVAAACEVVDGRPAGWTDTTHARQGAGDYATVFDRTRVLRVDLTVEADTWAAMNSELESILGVAFGEGGGGGPPGGGEGVDPRESMDACDGLVEGDACVVPVDGVDTDGTCRADGPRGELMCAPDGTAGGGGDLDLFEGEPSYAEATVTVDGASWCHVGMRFKGNSTLSQAWSAGVEKLPFRLDFDRFEDQWPEVDDQGFYGFSDLSFGNGQGDATYVRDVLASTILEDRGVPAARNSFAAVWLDSGEGPVYLGLYTLVEDPSDELLGRVWGDDGGNLYEGDGSCADLGCYDAESFEAKTGDTADGAEVAALVDVLAADRSDAAAWRAALDARIDTDGYLRWLAVNSAMENWDAYGLAAHNYYLYAAPDAEGRLSWIPWDHNLALMDGYMGSGDPLLADIGEDWPLVHHTLADPELAARYRDHLADALEGAYAPEAFEAAAETYAAVIEEAALSERAESTFVGSESAWDEAYAALYDHAEARRSEVAAALAE